MCAEARDHSVHRTPKLSQRQSKAHMIDVGHTGECASHSRNVKVRVVSELTGGRSVCVHVCV